MARISSSWARPPRMSRAIRSTSTVVLPVPAPARTSMGPRSCPMAWSCSESKFTVATLGHYAGERVEQQCGKLLSGGELQRGSHDGDGGDNRSYGAEDGAAQRRRLPRILRN